MSLLIRVRALGMDCTQMFEMRLVAVDSKMTDLCPTYTLYKGVCGSSDRTEMSV